MASIDAEKRENFFDGSSVADRLIGLADHTVRLLEPKTAVRELPSYIWKRSLQNRGVSELEGWRFHSVYNRFPARDSRVAGGSVSSLCREVMGDNRCARR